MVQDKTYKGIAYSTFVVSWKTVKTKCKDLPNSMFEDWLNELTIGGEVIPSEIIFEIMEFKRDMNTFLKDVYYPLVNDVEDFYEYVCLLEDLEE